MNREEKIIAARVCQCSCPGHSKDGNCIKVLSDEIDKSNVEIGKLNAEIGRLHKGSSKIQAANYLSAADIVKGYEHKGHRPWDCDKQGDDEQGDCDYCRELIEIQKDLRERAIAFSPKPEAES